MSKEQRSKKETKKKPAMTPIKIIEKIQDKSEKRRISLSALISLTRQRAEWLEIYWSIFQSGRAANNLGKARRKPSESVQSWL